MYIQRDYRPIRQGRRINTVPGDCEPRNLQEGPVFHLEDDKTGPNRSPSRPRAPRKTRGFPTSDIEASSTSQCPSLISTSQQPRPAPPESSTWPPLWVAGTTVCGPQPKVLSCHGRAAADELHSPQRCSSRASLPAAQESRCSLPPLHPQPNRNQPVSQSVSFPAFVPPSLPPSFQPSSGIKTTRSRTGQKNNRYPNDPYYKLPGKYPTPHRQPSLPLSDCPVLTGTVPKVPTGRVSRRVV